MTIFSAMRIAPFMLLLAICFAADDEPAGEALSLDNVRVPAAGEVEGPVKPGPAEAKGAEAPGPEGKDAAKPPIAAMPDIFGGPVLKRNKLTGNWGGVRNKMAEKGIIAELDLTTVYQSQLSGGAQGDSLILNTVGKSIDHNEIIGLGDILLVFDTNKAGLWKDGTFKFRAQGRFGDSLQARSGSITPINLITIQPTDDPNQEIFDIVNLNYTHFILPEKLALFAGLFDTLDADMNPFSGGTRGKGNFLHSSLNLNCVDFGFAPYKTVGGGVVAMPHERVVLTAAVYSRSELSGRGPFDDNIDDVGATTEIYVSHEIGCLPGGQCFGFGMAWQKKTSLDFDPRLLINPPDTPPPDDISVPKESSTWAAYYNFFQYVQVFKGGPKRWSSLNPAARPKGWGFFLRAGISDGNPNAIKWDGAVGLGGDNPLRTEDSWGVGVFQNTFSREPAIRALNIDTERGLEAYYNAGITPWLHLTADIQYIDTGLPNASNGTILGIRAKLDF